jgi:hypothetical protein
MPGIGPTAASYCFSNGDLELTEPATSLLGQDPAEQKSRQQCFDLGADRGECDSSVLVSSHAWALTAITADTGRYSNGPVQVGTRLIELPSPRSRSTSSTTRKTAVGSGH